jgi:hypothetical protein
MVYLMSLLFKDHFKGRAAIYRSYEARGEERKTQTAPVQQAALFPSRTYYTQSSMQFAFVTI